MSRRVNSSSFSFKAIVKTKYIGYSKNKEENK